MGTSWFHCTELAYFITLFYFLYVFGGLLLHGVWDSFADSPYGIFISFYYTGVYVFLPLNCNKIKTTNST